MESLLWRKLFWYPRTNEGKITFILWLLFFASFFFCLFPQHTVMNSTSNFLLCVRCAWGKCNFIGVGFYFGCWISQNSVSQCTERDAYTQFIFCVYLLMRMLHKYIINASSRCFHLISDLSQTKNLHKVNRNTGTKSVGAQMRCNEGTHLIITDCH